MVKKKNKCKSFTLINSYIIFEKKIVVWKRKIIIINRTYINKKENNVYYTLNRVIDKTGRKIIFKKIWFN